MADNPSGLPATPPLPRANIHQDPRSGQQFGFLSGTPAAKSDPQGTPYMPFGPGTSVWSKTSPRPLVSGDQKRGRK
jgi:hypothetical protein